MKATSKSVKASRAKAGVKPTSLSLSEAERSMIDGLAEKLGTNRKEAILRAVEAYGQSEMSPRAALRVFQKLVEGKVR